MDPGQQDSGSWLQFDVSDMEFEKTDEKPKSHDFIPIVECGEVINGVVKVTITNYGVLLDMVDEESVVETDKCLEIKYQPMDGRGVEQKSLKIAVPEIGEHQNCGVMYFKVPVHLNAYNFQFSICGIHHQTGSTMPDSPMQSVAVPSFLKDNNFKKGDTVSFRGIAPSISCRSRMILSPTIIALFRKRNIPYHRSRDR